MPWGEGAVLAPWIMNKNEEGGEKMGDDFEGVAVRKCQIGFYPVFPIVFEVWYRWTQPMAKYFHEFTLVNPPPLAWVYEPHLKLSRQVM